MSKISRKPIFVPVNVNIKLFGNNNIKVKGLKDFLICSLHKSVVLKLEDNFIIVNSKNNKISNMHAGTARSLIYNMIVGVTIGFEKKLILRGVGYKAEVIDNNIELTLGFSHVIRYNIPDRITIKMLSPNNILLKSADKCLLGNVAANIRNYKVPEVYKGKGIRYENEIIFMKESKKK